jgi:DNA invertase Pin-like site-specific DNA recombinase
MEYGYIRVSTDKQKFEVHLKTLLDTGIKLENIFMEKITGMAKTRSELDKLFSVIKEGDVVKVPVFSRIGRSAMHTISTLDELRKRGVRFIALDIAVDSFTPTGKLILQIFAALAEYERESILERTKAGQQFAKENGVHVGRPKGLDDNTLERVQMAYKKGLSVKETVDLTQISLSTVKRYRTFLKAVEDLNVAA